MCENKERENISIPLNSNLEINKNIITKDEGINYAYCNKLQT